MALAMEILFVVDVQFCGHFFIFSISIVCHEFVQLFFDALLNEVVIEPIVCKDLADTFKFLVSIPPSGAGG